MAMHLTLEHIEALRAIDTPTICNAIERFGVRGPVEGFLGMGIRCLTPDLGIMVGYAITVTVDSTTPGIPRRSDRFSSEGRNGSSNSPGSSSFAETERLPTTKYPLKESVPWPTS